MRSVNSYNLGADERLYFFEIERRDASEFEATLRVQASGWANTLLCMRVARRFANAIAAMLIHLEETTGKVPHTYFKWTGGNPIGNLARTVSLAGRRRLRSDHARRALRLLRTHEEIIQILPTSETTTTPRITPSAIGDSITLKSWVRSGLRAYPQY